MTQPETAPLHLTVALNGAGWHPAAWRGSTAPRMPSGARFQAMARTAERGNLDAVLLGMPDGELRPGAAASTGRLRLDPLPLVSSLIGVTERIGLGAAWSLDYTEPYNIARVFATMDHLSGGRT